MENKALDEAARGYINEVRKHYSPKTTQRKIAAIRSYGWNVHRTRLLQDYRAPQAMRALPHPIPEGVDGLQKLLEVARSPKEEALIAMCGLLGLRVAEALAVRPRDLDSAQMMLRVRGKGDKERCVPVSDRAWGYLAGAFREALIDGSECVICYSDRAARDVITRMGRRAGLSRAISSHDLRSTFATAAYSKSLDLRAVQELLGHASSTTTEGYTQVSAQAMRKAAEL